MKAKHLNDPPQIVSLNIFATEAFQVVVAFEYLEAQSLSRKETTFCSSVTDSEILGSGIFFLCFLQGADSGNIIKVTKTVYFDQTQLSGKRQCIRFDRDDIFEIHVWCFSDFFVPDCRYLLMALIMNLFSFLSIQCFSFDFHFLSL